MPYQIKEPNSGRSAWQAILKSGLPCRCPRCAKAPLFEGISKVKPLCDHCGLDLSREDSGDGPAPFITMILGVIFVGLSLTYEFSFNPPIRHHIVLWAPLIIIANIAILRPFKASMIALQYHFAAGERLSDDSTDWQSEQKDDDQ